MGKKYDKRNALEFSSEETRFFWRPLSAFKVDFEAKEKKDSPFYIPLFFLTDKKLNKKEEVQHFENNLKRFLKGYLVAWFKHAQKGKEDTRDVPAFILKAMEYFEWVSAEKLYEKVVTEQGIGIVNVPANNSVIEIMKFGLSLGIKITGKSDHRGGVDALELMTEDDFGGKMSPRSFIESISSSFPLPGETKIATKELTVNFETVLAQVKLYLPDIVWVCDTAGVIISSYKELNHPEQKIGDLHGAPIYASLVHLYPEGVQRPDYTDKDSAKTYRKGNVSKKGPSIVHFDYGYDLALMLSVKNSLTNPANKTLDGFDNHLDQERLKTMGISIHTSLLNMMANIQMKSQTK